MGNAALPTTCSGRAGAAEPEARGSKASASSADPGAGGRSKFSLNPALPITSRRTRGVVLAPTLPSEAPDTGSRHQGQLPVKLPANALVRKQVPLPVAAPPPANEEEEEHVMHHSSSCRPGQELGVRFSEKPDAILEITPHSDISWASSQPNADDPARATDGPASQEETAQAPPEDSPSSRFVIDVPLAATRGKSPRSSEDGATLNC